MWPFRRKSSLHGSGCTDPDCAGWPHCTPATPPQQLCFRSYDLPSGRTWESFRFLAEEFEDVTWGGDPIDQLVTDEPGERDRLVAAFHRQAHDARVTDRTTGEVTYTRVLTDNEPPCGSKR